MKKVILAITALVMLFILTGCGPSTEQIDCEQSGGSWEVDYIYPITTYVMVGKVMVPTTTYVTVYECVE